jgi:hypothetical protein
MPEQQLANMLTTAEVAARLNVSEDTSLRLMKSTPGVLKLTTGSRTLYRMPLTVLTALVARNSATKKGRTQ